jgi:hypothetical protein
MCDELEPSSCKGSWMISSMEIPDPCCASSSDPNMAAPDASGFISFLSPDHHIIFFRSFLRRLGPSLINKSHQHSAWHGGSSFACRFFLRCFKRSALRL